MGALQGRAPGQCFLSRSLGSSVIPGFPFWLSRHGWDTRPADAMHEFSVFLSRSPFLCAARRLKQGAMVAFGLARRPIGHTLPTSSLNFVLRQLPLFQSLRLSGSDSVPVEWSKSLYIRERLHSDGDLVKGKVLFAQAGPKDTKTV